MHLFNMMERWAAPDAQIERRQQTTKGGSAATTAGVSLPLTSEISSIISSAAQQTTTPDPTTAAPQPATTQQAQTTNTPAAQTTTQAKTTQAPSTTAQQTTQNKATPSTTVKQSTTVVQPTDTGAAVTTVITPTVTDAPTGASSYIPQVATTSAGSKGSGTTGGFDSLKSNQVATGIGVVAGVVGGFAFIVVGIYFWRRHQRRKQMERIGSMEELARPPSPGPLSRSFTGRGGPRQPIDDDDDFLTPMDTLPNSHPMDEYNKSGATVVTQETAFFDDKSAYAESTYQAESIYEHEHDQVSDLPPSLPPMFPVQPPAAVTAANGRYYSGDFSGMRPKTAQSTSGESATNIPAWSAMNKYTAFAPGAAVTTPFGGAVQSSSPVYQQPTSPVYQQSTSPVYQNPGPANNRMSTSRPGGGYRSYDSHDAGGYV
ncbi:hypothetical protein BT63DRAFT_73008 [Microthyrium microscopicum]|uniref:Mid2 domain-containing protein n=1 Tax=Microthyrium microscopicum TaxID=703497 RepID=A0A6A6U3K2_9PEZI|nr:hypothetical protein BT63DRAFT_73008 [Microthyrium microscopicum]